MSASIPRHVAIIPDGNRRWARQQGLKAFAGHNRGFEIAREVGRHAVKRGIEYLTLWGLSVDNLTKRSRLEVVGLLRIFNKMFREMLTDEDIHKNKVKVQAFGRWREKFPANVVGTIERTLAATQDYDQHTLTILLAYDGTDEMLHAISTLRVEMGGLVTGEALKQHLFTKDLPPVDLVIRTGGEPHLSAGFMMWDVADAELCFPEVYWPDFTPAEFDKALDFYANRERRFGK